MDRRAFEQHILELVHRYGVRHLTTRRVAAEFSISEEEAERHLDELVTVGTLELDTDDSGNLFYYAPGSVDGGVFAGNRDVQVQDQQPAGYRHEPQAPQNSGQRGFYNQPPGQGYGNQQQPPLRPGYGAPQQSPAWQPPRPHVDPYGHDPRQPQGYSPQSHDPAHGPQAYGQNYPVPYQGNQYPAELYHQSAKNPTTAALLSFFPGAGQLYNGEFGKAFFFFFLTTFFYMMPPFGFLMGMLPHAWSVLDAAASARRSNYGMLPP